MKRSLLSSVALSAGLGTGVTLTARRYRRDLAAARDRLDRPAAPVRRFSSSVGAVEYADLGAGLPVLVLHGSSAGWDGGLDWARRRLDPRFRAICPSRFGYPGSELPAGLDAAAGTARQADVLVELLDHLGLERVAVVALSAGSITAAQLVARHPGRVRALVLESPVLPTAKPLRQPPAAVFRALSRSEPLGWLTASVPPLVAAASGAPWHRLEPAARDELRQILRTVTPVGPRSAGTGFDNLVAYQLIARDELPWENVHVPTLVIAAQDAPLPTPADVAAVLTRLPGARLLAPPTGGHLLLGNVALLRAELIAFLTPAEPGADPSPGSENG